MDLSLRQQFSNWLRGHVVSIARWRYWIYAALALAIAAGELLDGSNKNPELAFFSLSDIAVIMILMGIIIVLTESLITATESTKHTLNILSAKHILNQQLNPINEWSELAERLGEFLAGLISEMSLALVISLPNSSQVEIYGQKVLSTTEENPQKHSPVVEPFCQTCFTRRNNTYYSVEPCTTKRKFRCEDGSTGYCFPIPFATSKKAIIQLCPVQNQRLTSEQLEILDNVRPDLAVALTIIQQRKDLFNQIIYKAADSTRREISHDLHDTLGQNLNYLRLKLEQFCDSGWSSKTAEIQEDLERMFDVSNESLSFLRDTFITLKPDSHSYLATLLKEHGQLIGDRTKFTLQFSSRGTPNPLAPATVRQLFYVYREAFNNIEKHANANTVFVNIEWGLKNLVITIEDDGCGFDNMQIRSNSHLGMSSMQERIDALGGRLQISTKQGEGTKLTIDLPFIA